MTREQGGWILAPGQYRLLENDFCEPPNKQSVKYRKAPRMQASAFCAFCTLCARIHIRACTHANRCSHGCTHTHMHLHTLVYKHVPMFTHTEAGTHMHTHAHTDTHTCIFMLTNRQAQQCPPHHRSHLWGLYHSQEPFHTMRAATQAEQ